MNVNMNLSYDSDNTDTEDLKLNLARSNDNKILLTLENPKRVFEVNSGQLLQVITLLQNT